MEFLNKECFVRAQTKSRNNQAPGAYSEFLWQDLTYGKIGWASLIQNSAILQFDAFKAPYAHKNTGEKFYTLSHVIGHS